MAFRAGAHTHHPEHCPRAGHILSLSLLSSLVNTRVFSVLLPCPESILCLV